MKHIRRYGLCYINKAIFTQREKRESQKLKQNNKKKQLKKKKMETVMPSHSDILAPNSSDF